MLSAAITVQRVQAVALTDDGVTLLDQSVLPGVVRSIVVATVPDMIRAIQDMIVRGAPAIGIAGAYGVVLSARSHIQQGVTDVSTLKQAVLADADRLATARPTAVNLQWAIDRLKQALVSAEVTDTEALLAFITQEATAIYEEDLAMCHAIGKHGAALVPKGAKILTHCNAGALATAGYGTALGVVRAAFEADPTVTVYADETRPRLQGAKLTTWELSQEGIPVTLIADNMSAWLMKQGQVDLVIVGADRIARNGDTANKIGTYLLALAAKAHNIPFYVAAPSSTIDFSLETGAGIPIETRESTELSHVNGDWICPSEGVDFYNPAFDVTPAELITAIITEKGIHRSPFLFA